MASAAPSMRRCARRSRPRPCASRRSRRCILPARVARAPAAPKGVERQDEWVQIGGYTTVVRAEPTTAAPVLFAYTPGRPLRVIAREGGFAHVQDLGSGQYGWVKESALAPFTGGDRQREDVAPQPQVVASAAPASVPEQVAVPQAGRSGCAASARRQDRRRRRKKLQPRRKRCQQPRGLTKRRWWRGRARAARLVRLPAQPAAADRSRRQRLGLRRDHQPRLRRPVGCRSIRPEGTASGRGSSCSWA